MKKLYIISIYALLIFSSCSSYRYIDIQVLNPSVANVPKIQKLYLVDFRPQGGKYANAYFSDSTATRIYDALMGQLYDSLNYVLKDSPSFENSDIFTVKDDSLPTDKSDLEGAYKLQVKLRLYVDTSFASKVTDHGMWGSYVIYYKFQFQLINMASNVQADWYQFSGNTVWYKTKYYETMTGGIKKLARVGALRYAERIAPYWINEERKFFYSPNKLMRSGYKKLVANELTSAHNDWEDLVRKGTPKLASMAAYNLALISEMQDNLNEAETWLIKSNEIKARPETNQYLINIRNRKLSRMMLEKQMQ